MTLIYTIFMKKVHNSHLKTKRELETNGLGLCDVIKWKLKKIIHDVWQILQNIWLKPLENNFGYIFFSFLT